MSRGSSAITVVWAETRSQTPAGPDRRGEAAAAAAGFSVATAVALTAEHMAVSSW